MKRYLLLVLLTGCSTVIPVQKKFPDAPVLLAKASNLDTLAQGSKMRTMLPLIPKKARDFKNWMQVYTYWMNPTRTIWHRCSTIL